MGLRRFSWIGLCCLIAFLCACQSSPSLETKKRQSEAIRTVGEAYLSEGRQSMALKEFLRAEQIYSKDPHLNYDLGLAYMFKGKLDLSIKHFNIALEMKPDYAMAKNGLGTAYLQKGEIDAAIAIFQELAEDMVYATPHYPLYNLGRAYYVKKDYKTSLKYFQEAVEMAPNFVEAQQWIGRIYMETGRSPEAVKALEKARRMSPEYPPIYYYLGQAYTNVGNYQLARFNYRKVLELATTDSPLAEKASQALEQLKHLQ